MQLSIENWHTRRAYGDVEAIRIIAEAGFDAIDFSFNTMHDWDDIMEAPGALSYAGKLREYVAECGVSFCQAHAPLDFQYGMPMEEGKGEFGYIVKSMEFAAELGIPMIVVHGVETPQRVDIFDYNLAFYNALAPYCEKYQIKIAVENLFELYAEGTILGRKFGTPESFNKMLSLLDDQYFVGCVDLGHAKLTGYEPHVFLKAVQEHVQCLHVHCNDGRLDTHSLPYLAPFDWDAVMQTLKDINYQGYFNFELIGFLGRFEKELLPAALRMAAAAGRHLIGKL